MKYMGSKARIAKYIVPIIQKAIDESGYDYIEPFCGGCNIIDKIKTNKRIASDNNKYLIALWKHLLDNPLADYPEEISREEYNHVRLHKELYDDWYIGYVGFLASYNGRFFDGGYAKEIISKTGKVRNYYKEAKRNIMKQLPNLIGVEFLNKEYNELNPYHMVVYADPPYYNKTTYTTSQNFNYNYFWGIMREWSKDNIVFISEETAPEDFECIWKQEIIRTQDNKSRSKTIERLFKLRE